MRRFSIIVPLMGEHGPFEDTLASVLRYLPQDSQVIVVHDGQYADPHDLGHEIQLVKSDDCRLTSFLNVGMCYVGGEFTVLIRPGVEVDENWHVGIEPAFECSSVGCVAPVLVKRSAPGKVVSAGIVADQGWSRRIVGAGRRVSSPRLTTVAPDGPSSWLAAFRTDVLKLLAPFDESLNDLAIDLDIACAIRELGLENKLCIEFVGIIDSDAQIYNESNSAHGDSAMRIMHRFGRPGIGELLKHSMLDLIKSPINSWRLQHAIQRLKRNRNKDSDLEFSRKLVRLRQTRPWEKQTSPTIEYRRVA